MSACKASLDRDEVFLIPLSEEEISRLPFPNLARKLGGILVVESAVDPLLIERLRIEFKKAMIQGFSGDRK